MIRRIIVKGENVMITLETIATTRDDLRIQAKELGIAGRGRMSKDELRSAVHAAVLLRDQQAMAGIQEAIGTTVDQGSVRFTVDMDNLNASMRRAGREPISEETVRAAGMIPARDAVRELADATAAILAPTGVKSITFADDTDDQTPDTPEHVTRRPTPLSVFGSKRPESFAVTLKDGIPQYRQTDTRERESEPATQRAERERYWRSIGSKVRSGARLK